MKGEGEGVLILRVIIRWMCFGMGSFSCIARRNIFMVFVLDSFISFLLLILISWLLIVRCSFFNVSYNLLIYR